MGRFALLLVLLSCTAADARGGERFQFRFARSWPHAPTTYGCALRPRYRAAYEGDAVQVHDRRKRDAVVLRVPIDARPDEWMPWSHIEDGRLVFAWREFPDSVRSGGHDVIRAVDLASGRPLWRIEFASYADWTWPLRDGRFLIHDGEKLALLELASGRLIWKAAVSRPQEVRITKESVFVQSRGQLARVELSDGTVRWTRDGDMSGLAIDAGTVLFVQYRVPVRNAGHTESLAELPVEARFIRVDSESGRVLQEEMLHSYHPVHDVHSARIDAADEQVRVELSYVVLD